MLQAKPQLLALTLLMVMTPARSGEIRFDFDQLPVGRQPVGWTVSATNPAGPKAAWRVSADQQAPSAANILRIEKIKDKSSGVFNLCWRRDAGFRNGSLEAWIRADSGVSDQGGGLIWRARDAKNYYVARYNPLERNLRLYTVKNGQRLQLVSSENLNVKTGEWFKLKIVHQERSIEVFLNDVSHLTVVDDTFSQAGGVGFWTKTDAASSFDNLIVSK